ncbi:DUF2946 family protein [Parasphingorhabdus sp.]|uniref:DUF2946 family protein n=1 Tax=Parasphingorhabdus sp. TaxID=2709688 RepID=UPI003267573A
MIRRNGVFAALLLSCALLLKLLVPAGYMVSSDNMVLTVVICSDSTGEQRTQQISVPMEDSADDKHGQARAECPYTALSMDAAGGADATLLASAVAFELALGFAPRTSPVLRDTPRLRPPSRGPPLAA